MFLFFFLLPGPPSIRFFIYTVPFLLPPPLCIHPHLYSFNPLSCTNSSPASNLDVSPAFEPFWWLGGGEHYARPSPPRRAWPPPPPWPPASLWWPWASWCRQGSWWWRPPPHTISFAAPCGWQGSVGFRVRPQFATEQKCGVWATVPRQSLQAQEPLGSIWPLRQ